MDTLIIAAPLSCPPSESLAFRTLTLFGKNQLSMDILIEVEREFKDVYYRSFRVQGTMDYVKQLITPEEDEQGVRLDLDFNHPLTVKTDRVIFNNVMPLLGRIKSLRDLRC